MSKTTKATKTSTKYVYAYVFNGGVLKQNHCVVSVSEDHPETTVFNELKKYYGNDIKGAFYKCSKSLDDVQAGITFKLSKFALGEILYNNNFSETKKILLDVVGLKQCSGTINVYNKGGGDDEETEQKAETDEKKSTKKASKSKKEETVESEDKDEAEDSEPEEKKKPVKKTSSKSKKEKVETDDSEPEEKKTTKKPKKASSKSKETDTKKASNKVINDDSDSDSDTDDDVKPKTNNTSIELSDESDESDEEDTN